MTSPIRRTGYDSGRRFVVQQLIAGTDVSVDVLAERGRLAIAAARTRDATAHAGVDLLAAAIRMAMVGTIGERHELVTVETSSRVPSSLARSGVADRADRGSHGVSTVTRGELSGPSRRASARSGLVLMNAASGASGSHKEWAARAVIAAAAEDGHRVATAGSCGNYALAMAEPCWP